MINKNLKFTIIGSKGYIGSNLEKFLKRKRIKVITIDRIKNENFRSNHNYGVIVYASGVTHDHKSRIFDLIETNTLVLHNVLKNMRYDKFIYLSSTRIYKNNNFKSEKSKIKIDIPSESNIYDISKIMGESICNSFNHEKKVKIIRLSNVFGGADLGNKFLQNLISEIKQYKEIKLLENKKFGKDYIDINIVMKYLFKISISGKHSIYNLASGEIITNKKIVEYLNKQKKFKFTFNEKKNKSIKNIKIDLLKNELGYKQVNSFNRLKKYLKLEIDA